MEDSEKHVICLHEAAHAVVAEEFGYTVKRFEIHGNGMAGTHIDYMNDKEFAMAITEASDVCNPQTSRMSAILENSTLEDEFLVFVHDKYLYILMAGEMCETLDHFGFKAGIPNNPINENSDDVIRFNKIMAHFGHDNRLIVLKRMETMIREHRHKIESMAAELESKLQ